MSWAIVCEHLFIVLAAGILSISIGLPLGILAYVYPKARGIILRVVDLLQTIPSLALLGIIMVFLGAGKVTVILGITLYSLLPIVRNTCLGLDQVDPGVKEAARGMGMSRTYRVLRVEFPLAFPTVFTGIRIAVVNAIGTAVFAAFVGGGGLGGMINRGIRIQDMTLILSGTGALMVIAVVLDLLMGFFERQMRKNKGGSRSMWIPVGAILLAFCLLLPYGVGKSGGADELMLYDGDYSETQIMHHMVKLLVEERTDLTVTIQDQMSQVNNFKSLIGNDHTCDLMISYDGTLLTTFLQLDTADVPEGLSIYDFADQTAGERYGLRMLEKLGFDNTYAIAVPQAVADQYGLETVSDLLPIADQLVFGAEHEFFTQEGSMKFGPFTEFYGLKFKDEVSVDVSLKYAAAEKGSFDVTEVYATDGLNRKANLKVLEDDRNFFPDYNGAFLVRNDTFEKFADTAPDLEEVLNLLSGTIRNEDMVEMTYQVDVQGQSVDDVARQALVARGLLQA
ncbi:glycine betaine ABC transporter substrate-binding protein [Oscillibacter sp.]|uniref:glycine betaine ABC transporter substrate-binding protein n=1 Tax=Oscillibacter sp. TaxID=1945593 RepID=UPI00260CD921|nr:glycine betaine ABC transporter substrate-binding protein [Oscillibacter sp.]MDD3347667.1 glycine betaine ABC transporter substrate-binding protein [Oscillibacter sp.]